MAHVLEFDELQLDAQVGIATQSGGNILGRAVPHGGAPAAPLGFQVVTVPGDVDLVFNGTGTGGILIYPLTIVTCRTIELVPRIWKLANAGISTGWLVAMNIEGAEPGEVTIRDDADVNLANVSIATPIAANNLLPYPVFFFDPGPPAGWMVLRSRILTP